MLGVKILLDVSRKFFLSDCTSLWSGMETSRFEIEIRKDQCISTDLRLPAELFSAPAHFFRIIET